MMMMSRSHAELPDDMRRNGRRQLPSCYLYSSFIIDFTLWTNITIILFCKQFPGFVRKASVKYGDAIFSPFSFSVRVFIPDQTAISGPPMSGFCGRAV